MELHLLLQQYRERSQFYAWEVSRVLARPRHATLLAMLQILAARDTPTLPAGAFPAFAQLPNAGGSEHSRRDRCEQILRELAKDGFLQCVLRQGQTPFYEVSDFGHQVLDCLSPVEVQQPPSPRRDVAAAPAQAPAT